MVLTEQITNTTVLICLIRGASTIHSEFNPSYQRLYFRYGSDNQRYFKYDTQAEEITLYGGKDYEQIYSTNGLLLESKYYLTDYLTVTVPAGAEVQNYQYHYLHKDRLGSTTLVVKPDGERVHERSYDAFGKPRNGRDWTDRGSDLFAANLDLDNTPNSDTAISKRGFTDHEHLDYLQLIHMNGRMFDFNNGRFLNVDPFVTGMTSQSINPYTYIYNNPLSGTDPSGYIPYFIQEEIIRGNIPGPDASIEEIRQFQEEEMDLAINLIYGIILLDEYSEKIPGGGTIKRQIKKAIRINKKRAELKKKIRQIIRERRKAKAAKNSGSDKVNTEKTNATKNSDIKSQTDKEVDYHGNEIKREPKSIQDQMALEEAKKGKERSKWIQINSMTLSYLILKKWKRK